MYRPTKRDAAVVAVTIALLSVGRLGWLATRTLLSDEEQDDTEAITEADPQELAHPVTDSDD